MMLSSLPSNFAATSTVSRAITVPMKPAGAGGCSCEGRSGVADGWISTDFWAAGSAPIFVLRQAVRLTQNNSRTRSAVRIKVIMGFIIEEEEKTTKTQR